MTSSLTRENDALKTDNTQLRTNSDAMKDEIKQLTSTLLNKMAVNNENQIQQMSSEIATMKDEIGQLKTENQQLKVCQWSGIT